MPTRSEDEIKALVLTRMARLKADAQVNTAARVQNSLLRDFEQLLSSHRSEILSNLVGIHNKWGEVSVNANHPLVRELRTATEEVVRQQFPLEVVRAHTEELLRRPKTQRAIKAIIEEMLDDALQALIKEEFEATVRQTIQDVLREES